MSEFSGSPLAGLVLFIIGLAVAGTLVSGIHYYAVDLPAQQAITAPENWGSSCMVECKKETAKCSEQYCQGPMNTKCAGCNFICEGMCGSIYV